MLEDTPMTDPGNLSRITCPYHLWAYELDGDLASTPKTFEEATLNPDIDDDDIPELDSEENSLMEVTIDSSLTSPTTHPSRSRNRRAR
jgi:hypothetical protein